MFKSYYTFRKSVGFDMGISRDLLFVRISTNDKPYPNCSSSIDDSLVLPLCCNINRNNFDELFIAFRRF